MLDKEGSDARESAMTKKEEVVFAMRCSGLNFYLEQRNVCVGMSCAFFERLVNSERTAEFGLYRKY